jgi:3-dehydroquinate synthase
VSASRDTLRVELGSRSYDIVVGAGLLADAGALIAPVVRQKRAVIVTDENVAKLHLTSLQAGLDQAKIAHHTIVLPPGEATKDFAHFSELCEDVLALGIERGTPLIALGGGVIGDLTGFVAATLLRGLDYVQVPTTLLSQVDSSVGGKTAIDSRHGKNLIGAFHQPVLVLADIDTLATLPRRELLAGYAEVVKYGFIRDRAFFEWLEKAGPKLVAGDADARRQAVLKSCAAKAAIVAIDERETAERQLLNFGHTFGHALEAETGYTRFLHGEAVAWGMRAAVYLAQRTGHLSAEDAVAILEMLELYGPIPPLTGISADNLLARLVHDKKTVQGKIHFVLPVRIGEVQVVSGIENRLVDDAVRSALL